MSEALAGAGTDAAVNTPAGAGLYRHLLLVLDLPGKGTDVATRQAARQAAQLARLCGAGLTVLRAVRLERRINRAAPGAAVTETQAEVKAAGRSLKVAADEAHQHGIDARTVLAEMTPLRALQSVMQQDSPDLVMIATHPSSLPGVGVGQIARQALRRLSVPVMILKPGSGR